MSDTDERGPVDECDARTPLDRTIDRIGMGASALPKMLVYDWKATQTASRSPLLSRHVPMDFVILVWIR